MDDINSKPLVWIDCEMTGLDIHNDVLVEIATIITDRNLNLIEEGPSFVIHQNDAVLNRMVDDVRRMHNSSGLTQKIRESTTALQEAEDKTLAFIKKHCKQGEAPLCGNSVWLDKMFLHKHMPRLLHYLGYRIIDVSSVKELVTRWYPQNPHARFEKRATHRALDDVRESIAELRHYRRYFFV